MLLEMKNLRITGFTSLVLRNQTAPTRFTARSLTVICQFTFDSIPRERKSDAAHLTICIFDIFSNRSIRYHRSRRIDGVRELRNSRDNRKRDPPVCREKPFRNIIGDTRFVNKTSI